MESTNAVQALEGLVISYIILPARLAHLNAIQPLDLQNSDIPADLLDDLLASATANENLDTPLKDSLNPATMLYSIAIKCRPRRTPKQRRIESSWLQKLIAHVAESSSFFESPMHPVDRHTNPYVILRDMLRIALDHDVHFDSSFLERVLKHLFDFFDISVTTHWEIVSLCMAMDANVLVNASQSSAVNGEASQGVPNKLLQSLFENIIKHGRESSIDNVLSNTTKNATAAEHFTILKGIILPLAHAFAKSRNLAGFLRYWQEQLITSQYSDYSWDVSIWENNELQQVVEELVDPSLTVAQIEKVVLTIKDEIASMSEHAIRDTAISKACISRLVVLECVFAGCTTQLTLHRLSNTVSSFYSMVLQLVITNTSLPRHFKSSVWRILSTINVRWPTQEGDSNAIVGAAKMAFATVIEESQGVDEIEEDSMISTKADTARQIYREKFQAFRFVLSFASVEALNGGFIADVDVYAQVIVWVMMVVDRFTLSETGKCYVGVGATHYSPPWDVREEPTMEEEFAIASLALIVQCPRVLQ